MFNKLILILMISFFGSGCAYKLVGYVPEEEGDLGLGGAPSHEEEPEEEPEEGCDETEEPPNVLGTYETNFGSVATWTETSYSERGIEYDDAFTFAIVEWDAQHQFFIGENAYGFNRVYWHDPRGNGELWLCFEVQAAESAARARALPSYTPTDPANFDDGCSGASWTRLVPR